jgi:hypothetical protein
MTIYELKDLDHYILQKDDVVDFRVKNKQGESFHLKYNVEENFLMNERNVLQASPPVKWCNDGIFRILELDPYEFCSKYYGYTTYAGGWPFYKNCDFEAVTNVVKALYTLIETMNGEWLRAKGDLCTNIIRNGKEFGYNDSDCEWKRIDVDSSNYGTSNCSTTSADSTSSSDLPIDKLKKIASQIKTIKQDNNSKLKKV